MSLNVAESVATSEKLEVDAAEVAVVVVEEEDPASVTAERASRLT